MSCTTLVIMVGKLSLIICFFFLCIYCLFLYISPGKAILRLLNDPNDMPNKFGETHRFALTEEQKAIVEMRMSEIEAPSGFVTPSMKHIFSRLGQLSTYDCFKFWSMCAEGLYS